MSAAAPWRGDLLRVATWRAGRYGISGDIVHPVKRELAPARAVVEDTIELVRPALEEAGDLGTVLDLTSRLFARGGGATRQRRIFEHRRDLRDVVDDLADRTEEAWLEA